MAITSINGYIAAAKQRINYIKTAARTTIAAAWFSLLDLAGNPGAGALAAGNTANGLVPVGGVSGYPAIGAFGVGNTGYLTGIEFGSSIASRLMVVDRLFHAGAYAFNANVVLNTQPSFAARVPNANYSICQLWFECVTAFTGNLNITVTYTNQDGVAGRSTTFAPGAAPTLGRMYQIPLAAGDTGIQRIESVVSSTATAGTFNLLILRPLWAGRVRINNDGDLHDLAEIGMPLVFADSALQLLVCADSTSSGIPELFIEISNG